MRRTAVLMLVAVGLLTGACEGDEPTDESGEEAEVLDVIDLPSPDTDVGFSLEKALAERRSVREFTDEPLRWAELGQLSWAAQGLNRPGRRTNPSAGALYPIELYLVTGEGVYNYRTEGHRMVQLDDSDLRFRLSLVALGQEAVRDAPVVFVVCGVFSRTEAKYGDRAERYVYLEAGHVGQSVLLQAVSLELGAVPIGAFVDSEVQRLLDLPEDHEPLYLIPVGHPEE